MKTFYIDWSHTEDKFKVLYDNVITTGKPKPKHGDIIYTENIPAKYANLWIKNGVKIFRCKGNDTAKLREKLGWEKTDENDVQIIQKLQEENSKKFRLWKGTPKSTLLFRTFKTIQHTKVKVSNQKWAIGNDKTLEAVFEGLKKVENEAVKQIKKTLKTYPIWTEYLEHVKGVGPALAGGLIGIIDNIGIENFRHASNLRSYSGVFPKDGRAVRRLKGEAMHYNPELKTLLLGILADSLIKSKSDYKKIYDRDKERRLAMVFGPGVLKDQFNGYKKEDRQLKRFHADMQAKRKMVQVFMDHLWCVWRQIEGLSTQSPYPMEKLKHSGYIEPFFIPEKLKPFESFKE